MTWREADRAEGARIAALLRAHLDWAMFPLSNLVNDGMGRDGRYQMRFWLDDLGAVVGLSAMGMILPVLPGMSRDRLAGLRAALAGEVALGLIGRSDWARPLAEVLGLAGAAHDTDEPGFGLDLADLILPDLSGLALRPTQESDRALLTGWRTRYRIETLGSAPDRAGPAAAVDIDGYLARASHRILLRDGQPVAMTGFNAALPEIVQVGGVFTPPDLRGQGLARAAVALHLREARDKGAVRAVLFAANDAAAKAYVAIGFRPTARMTMLLLPEPTRIAPCP